MSSSIRTVIVTVPNGVSWNKILGSPVLKNKTRVAIFVSDLQAVNEKLFFFSYFFCFLLFDGTFTSFRYKITKKSQNSRNQCFSYYFCLMIEGSWSGSVSLTNGSGWGGLKHMDPGIRIRIRIRNNIKYDLKKQVDFFSNLPLQLHCRPPQCKACGHWNWLK